ncbi:MAG: aspartate 1-decarboxylase [Bacillota bacterium]
MYINMLKAKIHGAIVTDANLNYQGSITIDEDLLNASGIMPHEKVQVVNNNNGARFETYVIKGERGSGIVCLNGAAARLVHPGDKIIIIAYCLLTQGEAANHTPKLVFVDADNKVVKEKAK